MSIGIIAMGTVVIAVILFLVMKSRGYCSSSNQTEKPTRSLADILAKDSHQNVRNAIAGNPNTPVYLLELLAKDEDFVVRGFVARNPSTPVALLESLSYDNASVVVNGVALNTQAPGRLLAELAQRTADSRFPGYYIAENPNTPPETLELLSDVHQCEVKSPRTQTPHIMFLKSLQSMRTQAHQPRVRRVIL